MENRYLTDKRKSVCLFLLVFISYALIYMTKNCYSAAMASIVDEGIMSKSETGLIAAMFYLVYAPFQIVGGIAVDKYPADKLVLIGIVGAGISNLMIYLVEGYVAMIIIWSFNAIVQFGVWPGIFKIVSTQLKEEHRPMGIFYISMTPTVGLILSYVSAAFIKHWKYNFLFSAISLFILAVVFFVVYAYVKRRMIVKEELHTVENEVEIRSNISTFKLMMRAGIPFLLIVNIIYSLLNLGIKALAPVMLMESYEVVSASLANILNLFLIIAGPIGLFASNTPIFRKISLPGAMAALLALILPTLIVVSFVGTVHVIVVVVALCLLMVFAGAMSILFSYASRAFVKFGCVGTVTGTLNCMASLGIVLANYAFARVAELFGWQITAVCWIALASLALVCALIEIPIWSRFQKASFSDANPKISKQ